MTALTLGRAAMIRVHRCASGWRGSLMLAVMYVSLEVGTHFLGGDWGTFLFVTSHFVLMPFVGVLLILATILAAFRRGNSIRQKMLDLGSLVVPLAVITIAATGHPGVTRWLPPFR